MTLPIRFEDALAARERIRAYEALDEEIGAGVRVLHLVHSTNDPAIIAGAATLSLEILDQLARIRRAVQ